MWVRVEDDFFSHPKVRALDDREICLYFRALCEAGQWLTDGRVFRSFVRSKRQAGYAGKLVSAGLWHTAKNLKATCQRCWDALGGEPGGGWVIHDFLRYNPSKSEVETRRSYDRARKAHSQQSNAGNPDGIPLDSERTPQARTIRTNGSVDENEGEETPKEARARIDRMTKTLLKPIPPVTRIEVRAEATKQYRRPLGRKELA